MTPQQAYRKVRSAIKNGLFARPSVCQRCGKMPPAGSDGRATIHAHHADYTKPLDVEWICAACHRAETPLPEVMGAPVYGARNGQAKLTAELVAIIRASKETGAAIARRLGVDRSTVNRARRGAQWLAAAPSAGRGS